MNQSDKFIQLIKALNPDKDLMEAVMAGYMTSHGLNEGAWSFNITPMQYNPNPVGDPIGSYGNIMKQLPSPISAVGEPAETTRGVNMGYSYGDALPGSTRDIREETINEWKDAPKFPQITKKTDPTTKKMIKTAQRHIPSWSNNKFEPTINYANMQLSNFDMDLNNQSAPVGSVGP